MGGSQTIGRDVSPALDSCAHPTQVPLKRTSPPMLSLLPSFRTGVLAASALAFAVLAAPAGAQSSSAEYEVTFDATWSNLTHPGAYPSGAHFSPLIGGTHNDLLTVWTPGGLASPGIESMAESGSPVSLRNEINAAIAAGTAGEVINGGSIGTSPGVANATFTVTDEFPLVSLTTMIAPSPDWFVGVHDLDLFAGGQWADDVVVQLFAYDSGTDGGVSFTSSNQDTNPQDPIALQASGPFFGTTPLGTFTFKRQKSVLRYGSGVNPADSIAYTGTLPTIGQDVSLVLSDPSGTMGTPSNTLLAVSTSAVAITIPNFGLSAPGAPGELLVGPLELGQFGTQWNGSPVTISVAVPNDLGLVGLTVYTQGVLIEPGSRFGLTDGMALLIGQ
ncbi:MAG: hypothetical protein ACI9K5_003099 [Gammaproteobacteria bacterium]|jgi:hypothetical protein